MNKAQSLREMLLQSPLKLKATQLNLFISECQVKSHPAQSNKHFSMKYTASVVITNFTGQADVLTFVLLQWLDTVMPNRTEDAFKMDIDQLDGKKADVAIDIKLEETVKVEQSAAGVALHHVDDPNVEPIRLDAQHWKLFLKQDLVAEWDEPIN